MLFYLYKNRTIIHFLAFIIALLATVGLSRLSVRAQEPLQWSPPQQIPDYDPETWPPYLVANQNRTVHAISSQWIDETHTENVIMYHQWTLENGWTTLNDILLPPYNNEAWVEGLFLDKAGTLHLMFFGGTDRDANIYYTTAPASEAAKARAWESPKIVGWNAKTPRTAALAGDNKGNLVIIYHGDIDGNGLYVIYSNDNGETWSEPEPIFLTYSTDLWPWSLQMDWGVSGRLHAVWNVVNKSGGNETGYYAHLDNIDTRQWSEPMELAQNTGLGIAIPAVIERGDEVFLIFNNGIGDQVAPVQWVRRSTDGGQVWFPPESPFANHIGRNGSISFVLDSNDDIHVFFGQRIPDEPNIHGMWHSRWQEGQWGQPVPIVSGPQISDPKGFNSFDPYEARAVTVQGNVLLVTWRTDPGLKGNGVWYSYGKLAAPELPIEPLPTTVPTPTNTPLPVANTNNTPGQPTATPPIHQRPSFSVEDLSQSNDSIIGNNPGVPIAVAIIPVLLLIVGIVAIVIIRHPGRL